MSPVVLSVQLIFSARSGLCGLRFLGSLTSEGAAQAAAKGGVAGVTRSPKAWGHPKSLSCCDDRRHDSMFLKPVLNFSLFLWRWILGQSSAEGSN